MVGATLAVALSPLPSALPHLAIALPPLPSALPSPLRGHSDHLPPAHPSRPHAYQPRLHAVLLSGQWVNLSNCAPPGQYASPAEHARSPAQRPRRNRSSSPRHALKHHPCCKFLRSLS